MYLILYLDIIFLKLYIITLCNIFYHRSLYQIANQMLDSYIQELFQKQFPSLYFLIYKSQYFEQLK